MSLPDHTNHPRRQLDDDARGGGSGSRKPRKRSWLVAAGVVAALVAVATSASLLAGGGSSNAAPQGAIAGAATAVVQRRDLVETDIQTGTLGYCGNLNVYGRLAGTVTSLPSTGTVIYPDHALYGVEGKGVYVFSGAQPVRRTFHAGMSDGTDVGQLNRDLRSMGYDPNHEIELGDHFSEATKAAVKRWQEAHGLEQTGEIQFGRIVFQPGPRRVEKIYLSLGGSATPQAGAGGSQTSPEAGTSASAACNSSSARGKAANTADRANVGPTSTGTATYAGGAHAEAVAFLRPSATAASSTIATPTAPSSPSPAPSSRAGSPGATTPAMPSPAPAGAPTTSSPKSPSQTPGGEHGKSPTHGSSPTKTTKPGAKAPSGTKSATGQTSASSTGAATAPTSGTSASTQASAPGVALVTTSLQRVVAVALEASKQAEARVGEAVQVTLPSTEVVAGHIAAVAGAATTTPSSSSSGSSGSPASTVNVEITIDKRLANAGLDQAPVSVAFAAQRQNNVLSIPVTALVATAAGGYAVEEVHGTARTLVSVTPGLYAGGYVAVTGVPEGTVVTNASQ